MVKDYPKTSGGRRSFVLLNGEEIFALARQKMEDERRFIEPYLTLDMLAAEINVHRNALSAAINQYAGMKFPDWVAGFRIAEAERLAACGNESLMSIALLSGFSARSSFYRAFLKLRGSTPREALRKHNYKNKTQ